MDWVYDEIDLRVISVLVLTFVFALMEVSLAGIFRAEFIILMKRILQRDK